MSCTLFAFIGFMFSIGFFISYLRQDKKVDNVELNSTYLYCKDLG